MQVNWNGLKKCSKLTKKEHLEAQFQYDANFYRQY
ncbi:hypothetical protein GLO73106DRAFT_00039870 [Gloeocapsa sp. PCC 73106]|nr:hypothetical protein GLO73106DRAFT_00039870 [Gloeocapsa sp. PCC 73106]